MLKKKKKTRTKILQFLPVHINWRPCSEFGQSQQAGRHLSRCCGLHLKVQASNGFFKTLPLRGIRARSLWVWTWWYFAVNSFKFLIWWGVGLDECQPASLEEKGGWKSPPDTWVPPVQEGSGWWLQPGGEASGRWAGLLRWGWASRAIATVPPCRGEPFVTGPSCCVTTKCLSWRPAWIRLALNSAVP